MNLIGTTLSTVNGDFVNSQIDGTATTNQLQNPVVITFSTIPQGQFVSVDGRAFAAPQALYFEAGSGPHTLSVNSTIFKPQSRLTFTGWSNGGPASQTFTVPVSDTTLTASFKAQYRLATQVAPAGSGSLMINPSSADGFYDSGTLLQITAIPTTPNVLLGWSGGSVTGTINPATLTMTAPAVVNALFGDSANMTSTGCAGVPGNLTAWWRAEGNSNDQGGNFNGTLGGNTSFAAGLIGQAFSFDGSQSPFVSIPSGVFPFPTAQSFTFETWFKTTTGGVILGQQDGPPYVSIQGWVPAVYVGTDGLLRAQLFGNDDNHPLTGSIPVNDGKFHHVAVTFDGTNQTAYVDGVSIGSRAMTQVGYAQTYQYQLGTGFTPLWPAGNNGWLTFNGLIDEASVYSRALSTTEINQIVAAASNGKCVQTDLVVTKTADTNDHLCDADCSLREAIEAANALHDVSTITFNFDPTDLGCAGSACTINLTSALPDLSADININGPVASLLTVQRSTAGGTPNFSIFKINTGVTAAISHLTIALGTGTNSNVDLGGGATPVIIGGGIFNEGGTLTIDGCTVRNSGLQGPDTSRSYIGAGIANIGGSLFVINSTISGNAAFSAFTPGSSSAAGGGIYSYNGTATIVGSSISGNQAIAVPVPDASHTVGQGGGIFNALSVLNLTNSTVSGNSASEAPLPGGDPTLVAGGGIMNVFGTVNFTNSTISANSVASLSGSDNTNGAGVENAPGGGPYTTGTINVKNTIIAGNFIGRGGPGRGLDLYGFGFNSQGNNLIGTTDVSDFLLSGKPTDKTGTDAAPINPLLGPLMNNGGPTFTHALLYNSPAVDAGDDCVFNDTCVPAVGVSLTLDQRGLLRKADGDLVAGAHVDIGAYERQASESRLVPPPGSNVNVDLNDVQVSFPSTTAARSDDSSAANGVGPSTPSSTLSITVIDPAGQPAPPPGYSVGTASNPPLPAFDVSTTAIYTPPIGLCFYLPSITDANFFAGLRVLHNEGGVLVDPGSQVNFGAKLVCTQVSSLSPFVIAHTVTPTAANGSIGGEITDTTGAPIAGTTINLSGTQKRETITDAQGNYSFDSVETNGFYTVTPSRVNYTFSPANRSFSLLGVHTEASFTASANADHANAIDTTEFFVRQQYLDFLGREPDQGGLDYWSAQLNQCNGDVGCLSAQRIAVSAAFFASAEFQQSGSYIYRLYRAGLSRQLSYAEFTAGRTQVPAGTSLMTSQAAFANAFVQQPEFVQRFQTNLTVESFVDALLAQVNQSSQVDLSRERSQLIAKYQTGGSLNESRALVLQMVTEDGSFQQAEYNPSFVLMEYFGYLRRDADPGGYQFWLNALNSAPGNYRGMVCSFITSAEYQRRFSSVVRHTNSECGQ